MSDVQIQSATSVRERFAERMQARVRQSERGQERAETRTFGNLEQNPFYQIIFNPQLTEAEKKELLVKAQGYNSELDDAQNQLKTKMLIELDEYLQHVRQELASKQIELSRSDVYPDLQITLDKVGEEFEKFETTIKPLAAALDAIRTLREEGRAVEAFNVARKSKEQEDQEKADMAARDERLQGLETTIKGLIRQIEVEKAGSVLPLFMRGEAKTKIAGWTLDMKEAERALESLSLEIVESRRLKEERERTAAEDPAFQKQKAIRGLIDIGTEAYKDQQKTMVDSAHAFVGFARDNLNTAITRLEKIGEQIETLYNSNDHLLVIYTTLVESTQDAIQKNQEQLETFKAKKVEKETGEGLSVDELKRQRTQTSMERYISSLRHIATNSTQVLGELHAQSAFVVNLGRNNKDSIARTKALRSSGIATVADRLAIVITTINNAAAREQGEIVGDTFTRARKMSGEILRQQFRDGVADVRDENDRILKLVDDLAELHTQVSTSSTQMREGLTETIGLISDARKEIEKMKESVSAYVGVDAAAQNDFDGKKKGEDKGPKGPAPGAASGDPFANFRPR